MNTEPDAVGDLDWPPLEEAPAWGKVLAGIALIHWGLIAPAIVGLILGVLFLAILDFRHPDTALTLGFLGLGVTYASGLGVVALGLFFCSQAPAVFRGRAFAQATLVLTFAAGSLIAVNFTLQALRPPWYLQLRATFAWLAPTVELVTWNCAGLAVIGGLLFVRSLAHHLGETALTVGARRDIVWFCVWLVGLLVLSWLADFLAIEAPWLSFLFVSWLLAGGAALMIDITRITARLRHSIGRALKTSGFDVS